MYATILSTWLVSIVFFGGEALQIVASINGSLGKTVVGFLLTSISIFWLYGIYNIVVQLFGYLPQTTPEKLDEEQVQELDAAILLPTFNDFDVETAKDCVEQGFDAPLYILDDSTEQKFRERVDEFAQQYSSVQVIRRDNREGFKAGALNNAVQQVDAEYFAVVDSDERLLDTFLSEILRYFSTPDIGFVQANHDTNDQDSRFAQLLGKGIDIHWDRYMPQRNRYGFVMFLGHGTVFRRSAWEEIGGFPELVSEDLAFATRIREHGFKGVFAADVVCGEDFPEDYYAMWKRHIKWSAGTTEYIVEELPRFLKSKASITEKLDVAFPVLNLPLSTLFLSYILGVTAVFGLGLELEFSSGFYAMTLATLVSPVLSFLIDMRDKPLQLAKFLAVSTAVYCSLAPTAVKKIVEIVRGGDAFFHTTPKQENGVHVSHQIRAMPFTVASGVFVSLVGLLYDLPLLAVGSAFLLAPGLILWNRDSESSRVVRVLAWMPVAFLLTGVVGTGLSMLGFGEVLAAAGLAGLAGLSGIQLARV
ncbi:glycosyltransferase family 2 protein [Haloarcula litorea]|uniref:glycosyltransferase family 2 protein n=1 Tax=Haloarcula litorea TaxID=3032579 RepID=UPI0023E8E3AC|nr:glycosyltransferase family 2 protein [Halomicroarcula sp. GDY20]